MIEEDYTVLYFARIRSNLNRKVCYKVGKTQRYSIDVKGKLLKRTKENRYKELKTEFRNEFAQDDDIIILREIVIPTSTKVVYNANFARNRITNLVKPNGGNYRDCYTVSYEMYQSLMNFFDEYTNYLDDNTNNSYAITKTGTEYFNATVITDNFYSAEDYLHEDEEEWSKDEDNGSHLNSDSDDSFIASDDDLDLDDEDKEYVPRKKQRKN